jgi:ATP/maltotriose-dependent transcriptional regulator MalT
MPQKAFVAAVERGKASSLETMAAALIEEFPVADEEAQMAESPPPIRALIETLTERELEILHLIAEGMTNRQIAEKLFLSVGTVKWHINQICTTLHAQNRVHALARARELNLLS